MARETEPVPAVKPLQDAERNTLRLLVQYVARAFYEPKYVVVFDQLAKHEVLKDEDLAGRIGYNTKETSKLLGPLVAQRLVACHQQNEQKDPGVTRSSVKKYFYIDYAQFCNVVKWRIAEMRKLIDHKLRNELANKGYVCSQCKKNFGMLEVHHLLDPTRGSFFCDDCDGELDNNVDAEDASGRQDRMQRFNAQTQWIRESLRKTEEMVIPLFDATDWIRKNAIASHAAATGVVDDGLAIAGADGKSSQVQKVSVEIINDADNEARRLALETEAQSRRQQNALPAWHTHSTISGDVTQLGLNSGHAPTQPQLAPGSPQYQETEYDTKPSKDNTAQYYAQYYADLAKEEEGDGGDPLAGLEAFDDGGNTSSHVKPFTTVEGDFLTLGKKRPREDDEYSDEGFGLDGDRAEGGADASRADAPIVYVQGEARNYHDITEEDHELMTPEEYEKYFEAMKVVEGG